MTNDYEGLRDEVRALSHEELLQEAQAWLDTMVRPGTKNARKLHKHSDAELRGLVMYDRAHRSFTDGPRDADGRKRVNKEMEDAGIVYWEGPPLMGYWTC